MNCPACNTPANKFGKDRNDLQRFRCPICKKTFLEPHQRPLGEMRLPLEKAVAVIQQLVEGSSIRSTERITGVEKRTILSLLELVGQRCEKLMNDRIHGLKVKEVACDEIWGYVGMKKRTKEQKARKGYVDPQAGDAWCFIALERYTKLILAWHLGRRTAVDTVAFTDKIAWATKDKESFQINTDGFSPYRDAIAHSLGARYVDFAQVVKIYKSNTDKETRYSPGEYVTCDKSLVLGHPDMKRASTSHVERQNLTVRMTMRRMTRLTNAFSKKWANLKWAYALQFAYYNFCRIHQTLRMTPAMKAGITDHIWELEELLST